MSAGVMTRSSGPTTSAPSSVSSLRAASARSRAASTAKVGRAVGMTTTRATESSGHSAANGCVDDLAEALQARDGDVLQVSLDVVAADHRSPDGPAGEEPGRPLTTGQLDRPREDVVRHSG